MGSTVLVTGVSKFLGGSVARDLAAQPGIDRVISVDVAAPRMDLGDAEFVRADIRNPVVARVMSQTAVTTVVHTSVTASGHRGAGGARKSQMESNVLGTMQLLAACQATASVRRIVVKSTGAVYGSSPRDPAMFTEEMNLRSAPGPGFVKDTLEVEGYVRGVKRRRPDIDVCVLRMAHVVGPHPETALAEYLHRTLIPIPFGYDARFQVLHEDDAVAALRVATTSDAEGVFNVAGDGVLTLTQAAAIIRRLPLPVVSVRGRLLRRATRLAQWAEVFGEEFDFLLWGRVLDTTRMRAVLGFEPAYSSRAAVADFAAHLASPLPGLGPVTEALGGPLSSVTGSLTRSLTHVSGPLLGAFGGAVDEASGAAKAVLDVLQLRRKGDQR